MTWFRQAVVGWVWVLLGAGIGGWGATSAAAQVPRAIAYQGTLVQDGTPVDGAVALTFRLFDAAEGGTALPSGTPWVESRPDVPVTQGRFSVLLGEASSGGTAFPDGLFDASALYLEVEVDGETLAPRVRLGSTAYALRAASTERVAAGGVDAAALVPGAVTTAALRDANVTAAKLADGAVTRDAMAPESVGEDELDVTGTPASGQVLGYSDADGLVWGDAAAGDVTSVTAGTGLTGGGLSGDLTLAVDPASVVTGVNSATGLVTLEGANGVTITRSGGTLTISAPGGDATGIAGVQNTDGALAVTDPNGPTATINVAAEGITGTMLNAASIQAGTNVAVTRTASDNFVVSAPNALTGVATASALDGSGTPTSPLDVAAEGVTASRLAGGAVTTAKLDDGAVTGAKLADGALQAGANVSISRNATTDAFVVAASTGLKSVTTDGTTITGDGAANPLAVGTVDTDQIAQNAVTTGKIGNGQVAESKLDVSNAPSDGQVLGFDATNGMTWTAVAAGDVTSVTAGTGLTGGGQSGDLTLAVDPAGVVTGVNGAAGLVTLAGDNGVTISQSGGTITISAPSGDGTGVAEIQNTDGALAITDPTGPAATINVAAEGITGTMLNAASIQAGANVAVTRTASDDFVVSAPNALASVSTDGATIIGDGAATPLEVGAVGESQIADASVTPLKLSDGVLQGGGDASVTRDAATGVYTVSATAGLTSVSTDGTTITGDGAATPLGVGTVGESQIGDASVTPLKLSDGVLQGGANVTVTRDAPTGVYTVAAPNALASVSVDGATITGDGAATPLAVGTVTTSELGDASVTATKLATVAAPSDGQVLTFDAISGLAWTTPSSPSSIRFKDEVETIRDPLALVERLRGVRFRWTDDGRPDVGFIAEEVARVLPELVTYEADGETVHGIRYAPLVAVLVEAMHAQQAELAQRQRETNALRARLDRLEAQMDALVRATHRPPAPTH